VQCSVYIYKYATIKLAAVYSGVPCGARMRISNTSVLVCVLVCLSCVVHGSKNTCLRIIPRKFEIVAGITSIPFVDGPLLPFLLKPTCVSDDQRIIQCEHQHAKRHHQRRRMPGFIRADSVCTPQTFHCEPVQARTLYRVCNPAKPARMHCRYALRKYVRGKIHRLRVETADARRTLRKKRGGASKLHQQPCGQHPYPKHVLFDQSFLLFSRDQHCRRFDFDRSNVGDHVDFL